MTLPLYIVCGGIAVTLALFNQVTQAVPRDIAAVVIVMLLIVPTVLQCYFRREQRSVRELEMRYFADRKRWDFHPSATWPRFHNYGKMDFFRRGEERTVRNRIVCDVTRGAARHPVEMGDFSYEEAVGPVSKIYRQSFLAAYLPQGMPDLVIRSERLHDRVASAAGHGDIDFESKEFSDRYMVSASDKKAAYRLISPLMIELLLADQPTLGPIRVCVHNGWVGIAAIDELWTPSQFEAARGWAERFLALWPDDLIGDSEPAPYVHSAP